MKIICNVLCSDRIRLAGRLADKTLLVRLQLLPATFILATFITVPGCAVPQKVEVTQTGVPRYNCVEVVYELREAHGALAARPLESVKTVNGSNDETNSPGHAWSAALLKIQYPHPNGKPNTARVTLRLSRRPSLPVEFDPPPSERIRSGLHRITSGDKSAMQVSLDLPENPCHADDEIWALDFPKEQLDLLLTDLANSGFFDRQRRPCGGARLTVGIDRERITKAWTPESRLDDVLMQVYREGWLDGFVSAPKTAVLQAGWSY